MTSRNTISTRALATRPPGRDTTRMQPDLARMLYDIHEAYRRLHTPSRCDRPEPTSWAAERLAKALAVLERAAATVTEPRVPIG